MAGWIGVDLDGTLAYYNGWAGADNIGEPIPEMAKRVKQWISEGREVRVFTARASVPEQVLPVHKWLEKHGFGWLEVTNVKDFGCVEIWDDRAVRVITNTGKPCCGA